SRWLGRLRDGDTDALAAVFNHYRARLRQMVRLRIDQRVAARVDPSDVLQEVYLDVSRQIDGYLRQPKVCFYVWLRGLTWERLLKLQRQHLGAQRRAVGRELSLPAESSAALAAQLVAPKSSPSQALVRKELRQRVQRALARLSTEDREIILMRDFEDLSNHEVAEALGLSDSGATMRYGRALYRLKEILMADWPAGESKP
ncbi:MAG TPA: sigma-70 family RNA polymerase sigma factor, partial [Gemmataceae bacterium]|nr:sigma-70 family RNA polymerase sigma factor [Gemmataceae bacterium]